MCCLYKTNAHVRRKRTELTEEDTKKSNNGNAKRTGMWVILVGDLLNDKGPREK